MERRRLRRTDIVAGGLGFTGSEIGYRHTSGRTVARLLNGALVPVRGLDYPFLRDAPDAAVVTALRFTRSVPGVDTAIVGPTKPARWQQNAALTRAGPLPADALERIRAR